MRMINLFFISCAAAVAAGCGSDPAEPPPAVASVSITPDSASVILFDTLRLTAVARDSRGDALTDRAITWTSSDPGRVFVQPTGRVQALGRGTTTITAASEGKGGQARIAVVAPITVIQLTPDGGFLKIGDTLRLVPTLFSSDGGPPTDSTLTWSSDDTTRAVVSATGLVAARGAGTAHITAAGGRALRTVQVNVDVPVATWASAARSPRKSSARCRSPACTHPRPSQSRQ